jgi:hypothetical protein
MWTTGWVRRPFSGWEEDVDGESIEATAAVEDGEWQWTRVVSSGTGSRGWDDTSDRRGRIMDSAGRSGSVC